MDRAYAAEYHRMSNNTIRAPPNIGAGEKARSSADVDYEGHITMNVDDLTIIASGVG